MNRIRLLLLPLSFIYGIIIGLRNKLFDWGILKSKKFDLPVISVGNITVGGTGKTPHIEYLIELLAGSYSTGVLSRGYKRKTTGFIQADAKSTPFEIGDEPFQIYSKYNSIVLGVCERRVEGVANLLKLNPDLQVILLDDAYQHRYIKPGLSILLIDYNNPVFNDFLLPAGNLRESTKGTGRADIIIITKTPFADISGIKGKWKNKLKLTSHQNLYFSGFEYGILFPVFETGIKQMNLEILKTKNYKVLVVTGIANPYSLLNHLKELGISFELMQFPDHHFFNGKDLENLTHKFEEFGSCDKLIITTEKDAVRLRYLTTLPLYLKDFMYYLPVKVALLNNEALDFNKQIVDYVKQDSRIG